MTMTDLICVGLAFTACFTYVVFDLLWPERPYWADEGVIRALEARKARLTRKKKDTS